MPIAAPVLLVRGADDAQCTLPILLDACSRMASADVRIMEVLGVDGALRTPNARSVRVKLFPCQSAAALSKSAAAVVLHMERVSHTCRGLHAFKCDMSCAARR